MELETGFQSELSWKIFLDRYTMKDPSRAFQIGDLVIALVEPHPKWPKKDVGIVKSLLENNYLQIELITGPQKGEMIERRHNECDRPLETTIHDVARRIARGVASVEKSKVQQDVEDSFAREIGTLRFVPGGRIWAGAGTGQKLTFFNCYVIPSPADSRQGIVETLGQMIEIMSRGGGVGINISSLRPSRAIVRGVNGRSSGAVSWMDLFSRATGLVEQGGCFAPETVIATDKGLIPALELSQRIRAKESFQALTHEGPRRITAQFQNGQKQLWRVTTARGYTVEVTEDHKMGVLRGGRITTVPLKDLTVGDETLTLLGDGVPDRSIPLKPLEYVRSVMSTNLNEDVVLPEVLDERLAYLVGYMTGDGYVHIGKKKTWQAAKAVKMATADDWPEIRERLMDYCRELFNIEPTMNQGDGAHKVVAVHSRILVEWFRVNGLLKAHSESIRVPDVIMQAGTKIMAAFIAGYFDADGCNRGGKGGFGFDSVSRPMLSDIQRMLAAMGIASHIVEMDRSEVGWRTIYRLSVTGAEFKERFQDAMHFSGKVRGDTGRRNHGNNYPRAVWKASGLPGSYYQGIWDSTKERISYRALSRVMERAQAEGDAAAVAVVDRLLHVLPDRIVSIFPTRVDHVYDFEVEETHMLSGDGFYTSNSRRGALMLQIEDWHPDVWRFIEIKKTPGMVENANISVRISDSFMEAVKRDGDWDLVFPDTADPDYDELWDGNLEKWRAQGKPIVHYETVKAQKLWHAIIEGAWQAAEPGIVFDERHEKDSNSWYFNPLISTNPCITGDTLIATNEGLKRAEDLYHEGAPVSVLLDSRFESGQVGQASAVFKTGIKPVVRIFTREGYTIRLTPDHQVYSDRRGWVAAGELEVGEAIRVRHQRGGFGQTGTLEEGHVLGWLVGDGHVTSERAVLNFYGEEKRTIAPVLRQAVNQVIRPGKIREYPPVGLVEVPSRNLATIATARLLEYANENGLGETKLQVPQSVLLGSENMQRGFIQALFEADGHVETAERSRKSVRLTSVSLPMLQEVQQILLNFGIYSRIYSNRRQGGTGIFPDSHREPREYPTQTRHQLVISGTSLIEFSQHVGFMSHSKNGKLLEAIAGYDRGPYRENWVAHVTEVKEDGVEPVYDLTEPSTHAFSANGLVVHNCAEQPLPAWGVCTLGHVNLAAFYDEDKNDVDWDALRVTVRMGTRFLDDIVDATPYFFDQNYENQQKERRIGLGTMGLGELLIRLRLRYGSPESIAFIEKLYEFIATESYLYDVELAKEKGAFPAFDRDKYLQSGFMERMPEPVRQAIREHGTRNVTILTQAPTGTVGSMVGTSTGIEPFYALTYYRQSRLGFDEQYVEVAQEWMDAHPGEPLPGYFVGAMDLTPEEHVYVQAAIQRWTDSSISKTANAPSTYTVEDTAKLYELAYDLGCKGVTIYRDQSRQEQVLHLTDTNKSTAAAPAAPNYVDTGVDVEVYPVPAQVNGRTYRKETPAGTARVVINEVDGSPFEVFMLLGRAGSEVQSFMEALGRIISLYLRSNGNLSARRRLELVGEQLKGIGGANQMGFGPGRVLSVVDAIGKLLESHLNQGKGEVAATIAEPQALAVKAPERRSSTKTYDLCPQCDAPSLIYEEGCQHCTACGYSKC